MIRFGLSLLSAELSWNLLIKHSFPRQTRNESKRHCRKQLALSANSFPFSSSDLSEQVGQHFIENPFISSEDIEEKTFFKINQGP